MANDKLIVDGFVFKTKAEAMEAKNEYDGVMYMRSRTNINNPANVYAVYKSIIEKNVFKTPVGIRYLCELRDVLEKSGQYTEEQLAELPIPVAESKRVKAPKAKKEKSQLSKREVIRNMKALDIESSYRNKFINSVIINIILIIVIILVIAIANNSDNINVLNYRDRLEREYSDREDSLVQWEQQLKAREEALKQREDELENEPTVE
ncbi:MAG: hypothetical protein IJP13_03760 [Lachnospiraceae bacterium]|nr:hypothetical protein [Lachnospiraceae bacterium]